MLLTTQQAETAIRAAVANTLTSIDVLTRLSDYLKTHYILQFFSDISKEDIYKHIYQLEYQDYVLDFIYEVYRQVTLLNATDSNEYRLITSFVDNSILNTVIKDSVVGNSKDVIIQTLGLLRVYNVILDNAIIEKRNLELKLN